MTFEKLEKNLMDVVLEEQAKLGFRREKIRLYYPLSTLNHLLGTQDTAEQLGHTFVTFFCAAPSAAAILLTGCPAPAAWTVPSAVPFSSPLVSITPSSRSSLSSLSQKGQNIFFLSGL